MASTDGNPITPLAPGEHILMSMDEIENLGDWEFLCRITGMSPYIADRKKAKAFADIVKSISVRNDSELEMVYDSYINNVQNGTMSLDNAISEYSNELRNCLKSEDYYSTLHVGPEKRTVFIDPVGLDNDEKFRADDYNINAMTTYITQFLEEDEPTYDVLEEMTDRVLRDGWGKKPSISYEQAANMESWELLCAVTGFEADPNSSEDVTKLLTGIYVDKKNLADLLDLGDEVSFETIELFADAVRNALKPVEEGAVQPSLTVRPTITVTEVSAEAPVNEAQERVAEAPAEEHTSAETHEEEHSVPQAEAPEEEHNVPQAEAPEEEEISNHDRIVERGIGLYDVEALRTKDISKGIEFISDLTGVELSSDSTWEECKQALDKIIINGRSAEDFLGVANEPQDMSTIENKVIPRLTDVINGVFNGTDHKGNAQNRTYVLIKEDNGDIRPLKRDTESLSYAADENTASERLEDVKDRLLTKEEIRSYCRNAIAGASQEKGDKYTAEGYKARDNMFEILGNGYLFPEYGRENYDGYGNKQTKAAVYISELKNMTNEELLRSHEEYEAAVAQARASVNYRKELAAAKKSIAAENSSLTLEEINERADKLVTKNYIFNNIKESPETRRDPSEPDKGFKLLEQNKELERRMNCSIIANEGMDLEAKIDAIRKQNLDNYNKYQREKLTRESGQLHEAAVTGAEEYNRAAVVYAKQLNNEQISESEKAMLKNSKPDLKFSFDDLSDSYSLIRAIRRKEPDINMDNIYIGDKSIRELTGIQGSLSALSQEELRNAANSPAFQQVAADFRRMVHSMEWEKDPAGRAIIPPIAFKTPAGMTAFEITEGKIPEAKPEVKPLTSRQRRFFRQSTIDANDAAVKEYIDSVNAVERRINENSSLAYLNDALRINMKAAGGTALTASEAEFANKNKLSVENSAVHRTALPELEGTRSTANNLGITAPVRERTITAPDMNLS